MSEHISNLIEDFFLTSNMPLPKTRHKLWPVGEGNLKGRQVNPLFPIRCRICDRDDNWVMNDSGTAFFCDTKEGPHEPTPCFSGYIHTLDSISTVYIGKFEIVQPMEDLTA